MEMSHSQARQAMQAALDGTLDEASYHLLQAHLAECSTCSQEAEQLNILHEMLKHSLQARWPEQPPTSTELDDAMERIRGASQPHAPSRFGLGLRWAVGACLVLALVAVLTWSIRSALPDTAATAVFIPTPTSTADLAPTDEQARVTVGPTLATSDSHIPTVLPPVAELNAPALFPNLTFIWPDELPDTPTQVQVFSQRFDQAMTAETAHQAATQLGIEGNVYLEPSEDPSMPVYMVTDGVQMVRFIFAPYNYEWTPHQFVPPAGSAQSVDFQTRADTAQHFLEDHGLLSFPFQIESVPGEAGKVRFTRLLEGLPVVYGIGYSPGDREWFEVIVNSAGQVERVSHGGDQIDKVEEVMILSPQEAWQRLSAPADRLHGARYVIGGPPDDFESKAWLRPHPAGEPIDIYGYAMVYQPANSGEPPLVTFNEMLATGNTEGLDPHLGFLKARGVIETGEEGQPVFRIESWQTSAAETYSRGIIQRDGEQARIIALPEYPIILPDGSQTAGLILPDLPAEIPEGTMVDARGVFIPPDKLDWGSIWTVGPEYSAFGLYDSCGGGGGGGGGGGDGPASFGGGSFAAIGMRPAAIPTQKPSPLQDGERVTGLQGDLQATEHRYSDGSRTLDVMLYVPPSERNPDYLEATLSGEAIAGIEQFNNLPVNVWGTARVQPDGQISIQVERWEPAYPGLKIEEFAGTMEPQILEGREVWVINTGAETLVLASTMNYAGDRIGEPGAVIEIEGYRLPDKTFGGLPIIRETSAGIPPDGVITSAGPYIYEHDPSELINAPGAAQGKATIEQIDLVYMTASTDRCNPADSTDPEKAPWLYVQPVWRFRGHLDDGSPFEIQIQALADKYLR